MPPRVAPRPRATPGSGALRSYQGGCSYGVGACAQPPPHHGVARGHSRERAHGVGFVAGRASTRLRHDTPSAPFPSLRRQRDAPASAHARSLVFFGRAGLARGVRGRRKPRLWLILRGQVLSVRATGRRAGAGSRKQTPAPGVARGPS
eukprot:358341-Chlamydomonas_euryale.AAC.3